MISIYPSPPFQQCLVPSVSGDDEEATRKGKGKRKMKEVEVKKVEKRRK